MTCTVSYNRFLELLTVIGGHAASSCLPAYSSWTPAYIRTANMEEFVKRIRELHMIDASEAYRVWNECCVWAAEHFACLQGKGAFPAVMPDRYGGKWDCEIAVTLKPAQARDSREAIVTRLKEHAASLRRRSERANSFDPGFSKRHELAFAADEIEKLLREIEAG